MTVVYSVCAVLGGTVLICQFVLSLLGLGDVDDLDVPHDVGHDLPPAGGHDVGHAGADHTDVQHHHHGSNWFFGVVTFRTIVAALTFFGLAGLAGQSSTLETQPLVVLTLALVAGGASMYAVHWMMQAVSRLKAEGTARIERAVGLSGDVYLRVPGQRSGTGKIQLSLQNRTVEFLAQTAGEALPTGAKIVVVGVIGPDTVEVAGVPVSQPSGV